LILLWLWSVLTGTSLHLSKASPIYWGRESEL
jgi:hypothetical protein